MENQGLVTITTEAVRVLKAWRRAVRIGHTTETFLAWLESPNGQDYVWR